MSIQETKFLDIADAIREKDGTTAPIIANDFAARIRAIKTMPDGLHTIALSANDDALGTVTGGGIVQKNMVVTVSAAPAQSNYQFTHWKENDIDVSQEEEYSFLVEGDRNLEAVFIISKPSRLPDGYTEVEYIQNANTSSYINTKKRLSGSTQEYTLIFSIPTTTKTFHVLSGTYFYIQLYSTSKGKLQVYNNNGAGSGGYKVLTPAIEYNQKITITGSGTKLYLNDTLNTLTYTLYSSGINLPGSAASTNNICRYYYFKGTRSNTTSANYNFELIPCINPSGVVGFYDLTNAAFIGPTAGTFIAGPAV